MAIITSNEYELNPFPGAPSVAANNQTTTTPAANQTTTTPVTRTTTGPVPWGLHPLPKWIETELKRRAKEYGQNPSEQISNFSGPRSAWIRACSNGISAHPLAAGKEGFVLGGIHGFNDSYGFNSSGTIKIGTDVRGRPHEVPVDTLYTRGLNAQTRTARDFPHRPPPSIESLSCELNGANTGFPNLCRKATIRWKCNSLNQLNYLLPYFFTPNITCVFEWGWNNYDTVSLVDLTDIKWISEMFTLPERSLDWIEKSKGNYDVAVGFVTDYGYKLNELGGYDCYTTIMNANRMIEGAALDNRTATIIREREEIPLKTLKEFSKINLMSIDTDEASFIKLRKDLGLVDPTLDPANNTKSFKQRVFRIDENSSSRNAVLESSKLWLRMDLVQDIINAFYKSKMNDPLNSPINEFNIKNVTIAANRFLKPTDENVLVPNQYAPRLTTQSEKNTAEKSQVEDATYQNLFKDKLEEITKQNNLTAKIDDLRSIINPFGRSFPVYEQLQDSSGPGEWGYLSDLFFNAYTLKQLIERNSTLLRLLEEILQTINESLCQICQLKLVTSEYSNGVYSVIDNNMPGVTSSTTANDLVKITLGALESSFLKNVQFEIKTTSDMQGQIIFQSANLLRNSDRETIIKNIAANPLRFQYSLGDRIFSSINLQYTAAAQISSTPPSQSLSISAQATTATGASELRSASTSPLVTLVDDQEGARPAGIAANNIVFSGQTSAAVVSTGTASEQTGTPTSNIVSGNQSSIPSQVIIEENNTSVNITADANTTDNAVGGIGTVTSNRLGVSTSASVLMSEKRPARSENNKNKFFVYYIDRSVPGEIRALNISIEELMRRDEGIASELQSLTPIERAFVEDQLKQSQTPPQPELITTDYILYEKTKDFMKNLLNKPSIATSYGTGNIMPGTTLTLEFLGISGISYLSQFVIDHAPETYNYLNAVWQVDDIKQEVVDKNWTTTIIATVRPLTEARRL